MAALTSKVVLITLLAVVIGSAAPQQALMDGVQGSNIETTGITVLE